MAIVKMKRLTLLALNSDRDKIYDALIRTKSVQLKRSADVDGGVNADESQAREEVLANVSRVEETISFVTQTVERYNSDRKRQGGKVVLAKNGIARPKTEIDFDCYLGFGARAADTEKDISAVNALKEETARLRGELAQNNAELVRLRPYLELTHSPSWFCNTDFSIVQLSQLPVENVKNLQQLADSYETVSVELLCGDAELSVVAVVAHRSEARFFEKAAAFGLIKCPLTGDVLPRVTAEALQRQRQELDAQIAQRIKRITQFAERIPQWKVYVDYLLLREKKLAADGDVKQTDSAFVLEGFYPAEKETDVEAAVASVTDSAVLTFDEIGEGEFAPTLTRNNKAVKCFETVTNMYTPPQYHEIDPNPVMSVFYFVIFGLMMADVGYGLLLVIAGLAATLIIKQPSGIKNLLQLFGICGISAMIVGVLFGSVFGYTVWDKIFTDPSHPLHNGILPNPADYPMVMMLISLLFGVVHLAAGVGCKMAVKIKNKHKLSAWLADFPWIVVLTSLLLAIFNTAIDMMDYEPYKVLKLPDPVPSVALYVCLGALAVSVVFAGVDAKGLLGKLAKSFGSAYGIINYFSDVMSYIRIFGLLLSSALVSSVVNQLGDMVMANGGAGYVRAALVLVFAHVFNLVMGLMSIYIHNGRLQYVEFFGKFYEGDGQLFVPFGSDTKYTLLKD